MADESHENMTHPREMFVLVLPALVKDDFVGRARQPQQFLAFIVQCLG